MTTSSFTGSGAAAWTARAGGWRWRATSRSAPDSSIGPAAPATARKPTARSPANHWTDFPIGEGTVSLSFTELESKININTADSPLLQQVLTAQGADANSISTVSDSILDWIDPDDATRPAGAESDYYLGLTPSYYAKNAPMDSLDELLLVKGVTHNMYCGISSDDSQTPFPEHKLGFGHAIGKEPDYAFGLRDVFTPFSSGKINLLTADDKVLQLIPGVDTGAAQAIETARDSDPPIRNVGQLLAAAGVNDPRVQNYASARGDTYEVHATATIGQLSHEYTAVVYRSGANVTVVSFYRSK